MQNGAECCAATPGLFNRGYTVSISFPSATLHVGLHEHKHSPLYVNRLRMRYTCYTGKIHKMLLPSLMSYQAWSDTMPSQHTNTTATARILLELDRATETTSSSRHTHRSSSSTGAEKRQKHTATLTQKEQSCLCITHRIFNGPFGSLERHAPPILLLWSLLLPGIWKQARQGTHYIHVPLSPACHKLPFPSPVGRQLIRQQWASQPASQRCELWALDHFLSLSFALSPPSLSFSLCFYPPALALPLSHRPLSLSSSSSPAVRRNDSRWNQFTLPSSPCLSQQTEIRPTSIRVLPLWMGAWEEKMDSVGKRGVLKLEMEKKESGGWTRRWMEEKGGFNAKCRLSKKGM